MYCSNEEKIKKKKKGNFKKTIMLILKKLQGKLSHYTQHYQNPSHLIGMCMRVLIV
jgi:hypothetical protein